MSYNSTKPQPETEKQEFPVEEKKVLLPRKPYHKPLMEYLGDLRTVTLVGSTVAESDSGNSMRTWP